ncbi:hypothetical protein MCAMS1_01349 [biofilm metagenome]
MKHIFLTTVLVIFSTLASVVNADIALKSKDEIQGTWKVDETKNSLNDRRPFKREDTWVFEGDNLTILHIPREGTFYDQAPQPYDIEDGKIKVMMVGSSRFDLYTVVEKDDKHLVLKGKFGTYYYFSKK